MLDDLKWRHRLSELRAMLESERLLLRAGAIRELARHDKRRAALLEQISAMPEKAVAAHQDAISRIRKEAARNHRLLQSYIEGARDAADRIRGMDRVRNEIGAYQKDGTRLQASAGPTRDSKA